MRIYFVPVLLTVTLLFLATLTSWSRAADEGFKTADERACAQMLGFTGQTINEATRKLIVNPEVCAAYRFLLERNGTGTRDTYCYRSQSDRILKLNPNFAVGLYKSLTEIEKLYGGKNIIQSGFRCQGGNHNKGCAADIIWRSCQVNRRGHADSWRCSSDSFDAPEQKWIDQNGKNAPYNIHLRLRYAPEGHHVEPVNTQGCVTGGTVGGPGNAPSSPFTDTLRRALGLDAPKTQQPAPSVPQQTLPQAQQPTQYFPSAGTAPTSGTDNSPISALSTSSQKYLGITSTGNQSQTSIADQLIQMAYGTSTQAAPQNTGTTVPLYLNPNDVGVVQIQSQSVSTTSYASQEAGSLHPSQTFTSHDLNSAPRIDTTNAPLSNTFAFLETLKGILLRVLEILRPMGVRGAFQSDEHLEASEYEY